MLVFIKITHCNTHTTLINSEEACGP